MKEVEEKNKKEKGFVRKHLFDFLALIGLCLVTGASFIIKANVSKAPAADEALFANITFEGKLLKTYDLSQYGNNETHETIQGKYTEIELGLKHNAIHVSSSKCPGQECVHEGWVTTANHPIVCAYNGIYIDVYSGKGGSIIIK